MEKHVKNFARPTEIERPREGKSNPTFLPEPPKWKLSSATLGICLPLKKRATGRCPMNADPRPKNNIIIELVSAKIVPNLPI